MRKAVRGYRAEGLSDELANAERVLVAAGISREIELRRRPTLSPDEDRALAFALREAVTNVVRHAGATRCWIALSDDGGRIHLEVRDNGRGGAGAGRQRPVGHARAAAPGGRHARAERPERHAPRDVAARARQDS